MAFKRMKPVRPAASAPIESQIHNAWRRFTELKEEGRWDEARDYLENMHRRYPTRKEPLQLLLEVAIETDDTLFSEDVLERLVKIAPDNPDFAVTLAGASFTNGFIALARERFDRFLLRWPEHEMASSARETLAELETMLTELMDNAGLHQEDRFDLAARNDAIQSLIARTRFKEARSLAEQMLARNAFYAPALNNMALAHLYEGQFDEAVAYARRVLDFEPENVHALGNLAHALTILGHSEEAELAAERMRASQAFATDKTAKILETLSFLGDDEGILAVYQQGMGDTDDPSLMTPMPHHLAGAAAMRLGREQEARRYWKEALGIDPNFTLATENLADLKHPIGERHGPWTLSLGYWIQQHAVRDLIKNIDTGDKSDPENALETSIHAALKSNPHLETLVPILLERGDPIGRSFALLIASLAKTPRMLKALREFALGQDGPDRMRIEAANLASGAGELEGGMARMWVRGEWTEVILMGWELHDEVIGSHSPQVEELSEAAVNAIYGGDGKRAEKLIEQALEIEPNFPSLLFNLANAYKVQGRTNEAIELMLEVHDQFPDYFFGIVYVADMWREEGELEEAARLLTPLLSRKRLHVSEFAALAHAQIELFLAKGEEENARYWYGMLKQALPDHRTVNYYSRRFERPFAVMPRVFRKLFKRR